MLALRYNSTSPQMLYWENEKGVDFLKKLGIKQGDTILDFGCRVGHYTIPAAKAIGSQSIVYGIDTQDSALSELKKKKYQQELSNIRTIKTSGELILPFNNESIDVILFYDVLHYLKETDRKKLYREAFRVLKQNGLLSVYPKHCLGDSPTREFKDIEMESIKMEIQDSNFIFSNLLCDLISHDDNFDQGCILNFIKP